MKEDSDLIKIEYEVRACDDYFFVAVKDFDGMDVEQIRASLQEQINRAVCDAVSGECCDDIDDIAQRIAASLARSEAA